MILTLIVCKGKCNIFVPLWNFLMSRYSFAHLFAHEQMLTKNQILIDSSWAILCMSILMNSYSLQLQKNIMIMSNLCWWACSWVLMSMHFYQKIVVLERVLNRNIIFFDILPRAMLNTDANWMKATYWHRISMQSVSKFPQHNVEIQNHCCIFHGCTYVCPRYF